MDIVELKYRHKRTRALSERANRKYWGNIIHAKKMRGGMWDSQTEFIESLGHCYVCGYKAKLEKCHILAYQNGGSPGHENIHFLCKFCHVLSEGITGKEYWDWFYNPKKRLITFIEKYGYSSNGIKNYSYSVLASFVSDKHTWLEYERAKQVFSRDG